MARALVERNLDLHVTGVEHVPESGPAILVARHCHHLYDAAAILAAVPREVHILIAGDWLGNGFRLALMRRLAAAARWPMVWRRGSAWRLNRDGYNASLELLEDSRVLLVFPEGCPIIDPRPSSRSEVDALLPFDPGVLVLAERARCEVPLVPVGLAYARRAAGAWSVWLRFGAPYRHARVGRAKRRAALARLESAVRGLSTSPG
jgi:1-acyl-sn-glycerol-3-phosphate acyltransferase